VKGKKEKENESNTFLSPFMKKKTGSTLFLFLGVV
jgi:hypothetical protein